MMYYSSVIPEMYYQAMAREAHGYFEFLNLRERLTLSIDKDEANVGLDPATRQYKVEELIWREIFPHDDFPGVLCDQAPVRSPTPASTTNSSSHTDAMDLLLSRLRGSNETLRPPRIRHNTDGVRHCALRFPTDPPCNIYFRVDIITRNFQRTDDSPPFPRYVPIPLIYVRDFEEPVSIHTTHANATAVEIARFEVMVNSSTDGERALAAAGPWVPSQEVRVPPSLLHNEASLSESREQRVERRLARRAVLTQLLEDPEVVTPPIIPADPSPSCVICMATIRDPVIVAPCSHRYDHQCLLATMESLSQQVDPLTGELKEKVFRCMHCREPVQAIFHTFTSGTTAVCEQVEFPAVPSMPFAITTFSDGEEEVVTVADGEEPSALRWSSQFLRGAMLRTLQASTRRVARSLVEQER